MAEKLLLKKQITLTLDGQKRFGDLYFEPDEQRLSLEQNPGEIAAWESWGIAPWRWVELSSKAPRFMPSHFMEIHDFNHTAGVAGQLVKAGVGRLHKDRALAPFAQPKNPRRIKMLDLDRDIKWARIMAKYPPREKRADPWRTPAPA